MSPSATPYIPDRLATVSQRRTPQLRTASLTAHRPSSPDNMYIAWAYSPRPATPPMTADIGSPFAIGSERLKKSCLHTKRYRNARPRFLKTYAGKMATRRLPRARLRIEATHIHCHRADFLNNSMKYRPRQRSGNRLKKIAVLPPEALIRPGGLNHRFADAASVPIASFVYDSQTPGDLPIR